MYVCVCINKLFIYQFNTNVNFTDVISLINDLEAEYLDMFLANKFDIFFHLHCMCLFLYCALIYNCVLGYSLTPPTLFFEDKMAPPFEYGFMTEKFV